MLTSIASGLGIGSGIDTKALVAELSANARALREGQIGSRERSNTARVSTLATLKEGLASLASNFAESASTTAPADLKKLATAFVSGFNLLRTTLGNATRVGSAGTDAGPLAGETAARAIGFELSRLPQTQIATTGTYRSLSDIGIGVTRTGTLALDAARFDAALAAQPAEVAAILSAPSGLSSALTAMDTRLNANDGPLSVAATRYDRVASRIARDRERLEDDNARLVDRLTRSFSGMDRQVAQLKAVQSYIEQQVAAWNAAK